MFTILLCVLASLAVMAIQDKTNVTGSASIIQSVLLNVFILASGILSFVGVGLVLADLIFNKSGVAKLAASLFE